jgi:hypothetical protein
MKLIPPRAGRSPYWTVRGVYMDRLINKSTRATTREEAEKVLAEMMEKVAAGDGLVWKKIPGFSRYEISDNGQVRRLPAILKQTRQPSGHLAVTIYSDDGKQWRTSAHHLVARAFLGEPPTGKPYACHKNGQPDENAKENLYWGSPVDNAADAKRHYSLIRQVGESVVSQRFRYRRKRKPATAEGLAEGLP